MDAPMLGRDKGDKENTLAILVEGRAKIVATLESLFQAMG